MNWHHHKDMIQAGLVALGYTGITLSQIDLGVKILAGLITAGYMIWKWRTEYKRGK